MISIVVEVQYSTEALIGCGVEDRICRHPHYLFRLEHGARATRVSARCMVGIPVLYS